MNSESRMSRLGHCHATETQSDGRLHRPVPQKLARISCISFLCLPLTSPSSLLLYILPMRGCLKHHSLSNSTTIATPPPTRDPTPPLIPPDAPSLAAKRRPPPTLTDECLSRRCVHFCNEIVDKIFVADEWDRSPADVTPRLTYQ